MPSPTGHKADVRITHSGDGYDVLVEDEGPGIPESDRQQRVRALRCGWKAPATRPPAAPGWG